MCEVRSREKRPRTKKKKYNGQQQKEMDCREPHPAPNEKMQGIQWTERPTGALVAAGSLWPFCRYCARDLGIWRPGGNVTSSSSSPELAKKLKDQCQQTHTWTT
jgi:hypothetical protein